MQIGRVAMITYGPDEGKLCVIVDVVDQTRVRHVELVVFNEGYWSVLCVPQFFILND